MFDVCSRQRFMMMIWVDADDVDDVDDGDDDKDRCLMQKTFLGHCKVLTGLDWISLGLL